MKTYNNPIRIYAFSIIYISKLNDNNIDMNSEWMEANTRLFG